MLGQFRICERRPLDLIICGGSKARPKRSQPSLLRARRLTTASASSKYSGYETIHDKPPSAYGWRYHLDNTIQFILWASFGSAAIHLLNIKQKYKDKDRRLSTKIAILKDVIRRVGEGEDVDIARELQVGKTEEEKEWEEVINSFKEAAGLSEEEINQAS